MKGIILAGGKGNRLNPLTKVHNKQLLPVGQYPMIYHGLSKFISLEIEEVLIVTGKNDIENVVAHLEDGQQWDMDLSYRIQHEPLGVAHALSLAEDFIDEQDFMVLLGDNLFQDNIKSSVQNFEAQGEDAHFFLKEVEKPSNYGVANFDGNNLKKIVEKPPSPPSSYIVTGIYLYSPNVFHYIQELELSPKGEYEISDLNNILIQNKNISTEELEDWWIDAGTLENYQKANEHLRGKTLKFIEN